MSDYSTTNPELEAFEEWLEETAAREGSSTGEVLNQLMSTYWILNELNTVLEDTPYDDIGALEGGSEATAATESSGNDHEAIVEVIQSIAEMNAGPESRSPTPSSSVDPGIIQLIEVLRDSETGSSRSSTGEDVSRYRIEKLQDDVDSLSKTVATIENKTGELDEQYETVLVRQQRQVSQLRDDIDRLESVLDGVVEPSELDAVDSRIDEIDDRFEDAYANIRQILEHLLTTSEANSDRIDVIVDVVESEFEELIQSQKAYDQLVSLKNEAHRRGVTVPRCDACDNKFDVALLGEPYCPECDREITGFETKSKLIGTKQIAQTRAKREDIDRESDLIRRIRRRLDRAEANNQDTAGELSLDDPGE